MKKLVGVAVAMSIVLTLTVLVSLASGQREEQLPFIDLSRREPISVPEAMYFRIAVAAVISPRGTALAYADLADYLGEKLRRPVKLVQRSTYAEVNQLVERGEVEIAFVCSSAYVIGHREFGMQLLAAPEVNGKAVYHSWLIVPADSPARSMADLRGKSFAFTDPWSNTGRLYPASLVKALGETPRTFFSRTFYTRSHDDAVRAVANGQADGAGVDNLVYLHLLSREPEIGDLTKVIDRSPPMGIPPVVTSPRLSQRSRNELKALLLGMRDDPEGRAALRALEFDRFVEIDDRAYDSIRALESLVEAEAGR